MSYNNKNAGGYAARIKRTSTNTKDKKPRTVSKKPVNSTKQRVQKNQGGGLVKRRLSESQMKRIKEHSKLHGGMNSKHIKKMIYVMENEGKSFAVAHKIATSKVGK